jgi:hypothetical protein
MTAKDNRPAAFKDDPHSHMIETLSTGRSLQVEPPALIITGVGRPLLKMFSSAATPECKGAEHLPFRGFVSFGTFSLPIALPKADAHSPTQGRPRSIREGSAGVGFSHASATLREANRIRERIEFGRTV